MPIPNILIVDDEQDIRKRISDHLRKRMECHIIEAANGYEALEEFQKDQIDIILLDMKMPGISGTEVIKKAREKSNIPIIVISGLEGAAISRHLEECGVDEYITKPFSLKVVQEKVVERLKKCGKYFPKQP
ncbi:MAG: response regulator [Candidatus Omnitrophica bacterium]|nr:response regulator [Candidatus Omnitrophota bacterium]